MKFASVSKGLVLGLALLLASSAFAGTGSKASLQLSNPVSVNGTTLKPGDYKLEWEGSGPNVELSIMQGKNVVAKVPAHIVDLDNPAANTAAVTKKQDSGPNTLAAIRFQGKKMSLEIGDSSGDAQSGSSK